MLTGKRFSIITLFVSVLIFSSTQAYANKSVYVVSDTLTSQLKAYEVDGSSLSWQKDYVCQLAPGGGMGAVGIAIDESGYGQFLFVTFEKSDKIELINAKTMQYVDMVVAPGADDLAGVVMDTNNSKLYAVDRYTNHLYSWTWNPAAKSLTPDFNDPYYIELEGLEDEYPKGAFGIALDEENKLLYVADNTDSIKFYKTNDWNDVNYITVSCNVISIAIDVPNQLLYYTSMGFPYGQEDTNLYQYDITAQQEKDSVDVECPVAGIAVDQETSLIYITTYGGSSDNIEPFPKDRLMVYNSSLQQLWFSDDIGNPAGVAVAANVGYKPPVFSIVKDNNDQEDGCVEPFVELFPEYLVFDIYWDANGTADTNAFVIDYLPDDLDYYSSVPDANDHNSIYNTVTWSLGDITGTDVGSIKITTKVKDSACSCRKLTNTAYLEGDNYCGLAAVDVNVCFLGGDIVYVDKDVNDPDGSNNGTNWQDAFSELQTALNCLPESFSSIWIAQGTYKPVYDTEDGYEDQSFKLINDLALLGHFEGFNFSVHLCKSVSNTSFVNLCQKNIESNIGFWYNIF